MILAASPAEKASFRDSFFEERSVFFKLLLNPASLRHAGWNLRTVDTPRMRNGEFWEVNNGDRKKIRLYSDASLVAFASVDQDFLGWRREATPARLHALAAIEFIYEFVELYRLVLTAALQDGTKIKACRLKIGMRNTPIGPERMQTVPYEANTWGFMMEGMGEKYEVDADFLKEVSQEVDDDIFDSKYVAYKLVRILFLQFGVPVDRIPYSKADESESKFVDIEKIKKL